jgi:hypothetical protein
MSYLELAKRAEEELKKQEREAAKPVDPTLCCNCGEPWSEVVTDIYGRRWNVCWRPSCLKSA